MGTNAGTVGTPHYLAPEMISGEPHMVDERTDVYLLGATLHYLLVGRPRHDAPARLWGRRCLPLNPNLMSTDRMCFENWGRLLIVRAR